MTPDYLFRKREEYNLLKKLSVDDIQVIDGFLRFISPIETQQKYYSKKYHSVSSTIKDGQVEHRIIAESQELL